jgi:hypothetical protein
MRLAFEGRPDLRLVQKKMSFSVTLRLASRRKHCNGVAPLAMPRGWRIELKKNQAEKIP